MRGAFLPSTSSNLKETRWRYSGVRFKAQNIVYKLLINTIYCDIIKLVGRFLPPVHHLFSHLLHTDGVAAIVPLPLLCEIYAARVNQPKNPGRRVAPSMRQPAWCVRREVRDDTGRQAIEENCDQPNNNVFCSKGQGADTPERRGHAESGTGRNPSLNRKG